MKKTQKERKQPTLWEFSSLEYLSPESLETAKEIFYQCSENIVIHLTKIFETTLDLTLDSLEQVTFEKHLKSLSLKKTIPSSLNIDPIIIHRLSSINLELQKDEIEKKITSSFYDKINDAFNDNSFFNPTTTKEETILKKLYLIISFKMSIEKTSGFITLAIPTQTLEPFLKKKQPSSQKENREIQENLKTINLTLSASLGKVTLSKSDFLQLEKDDLLCLNQKCDLPITITIGKVKKMTAFPGLVGQKKGLLIKEIH